MDSVLQNVLSVKKGKKYVVNQSKQTIRKKLLKKEKT